MLSLVLSLQFSANQNRAFYMQRRLPTNIQSELNAGIEDLNLIYLRVGGGGGGGVVCCQFDPILHFDLLQKRKSVLLVN